MTLIRGTAIREIGLGIIGLVHEFVVSDKAEIAPIMIFALLVIQGVATLLRKA